MRTSGICLILMIFQGLIENLKYKSIQVAQMSVPFYMTLVARNDQVKMTLKWTKLSRLLTNDLKLVNIQQDRKSASECRSNTVRK